MNSRCRTLIPPQTAARVQLTNTREENKEFMSARRLKPSVGGAGEAASEVISQPDKVVDAIYRGILMGRFVPGQKLIEADLGLSFGVSRGPVREALKRLSAEGVVELTRHRGGYIRVLTRREAIDFLEILEVLTCFIARKAVAAAGTLKNAAEVREAFEMLARYRNPQAKGKQLLEQRVHFYDTLIKAGGNSQIASVMPMMRIHLLRLQAERYFSGADLRDRIDEYAAVTEAVLSGDAPQAERAMRRHIKQAQARLAKLPEEAFARE
jgi:DNA-binding GntR family transcriptional regulator